MNVTRDDRGRSRCKNQIKRLVEVRRSAATARQRALAELRAIPAELGSLRLSAVYCVQNLEAFELYQAQRKAMPASHWHTSRHAPPYLSRDWSG